MSTSPTIVPVPQSRRSELVDVDLWAFAAGIDDDQTTLGFEWDRSFGAELDGRLVGVYSVYSLATSTPGGGSVPTAGLTWVGVHPQFRRRGVLRTMIGHHLENVRERGTEPISALWAAEPAIYGRFGYGAATTGTHLVLPRGAALVDVAGTEQLQVSLETVDVDRHSDLLDACHRASGALRPGVVTRQTESMRRWRLGDRRATRGHFAEPLRVLLVTGPEGLRGYALFTRDQKWTDTGPASQVVVRESVTLDAAAARVLWGVLTDLDLTTSTRTESLPHDDPLLHQLVDLRAAAPRVGDGIWVRVVDLPGAFAGRLAAAPLDLVVEVDDVVCPWNAGRWRLTAAGDGHAVEATRTDDDAHVRLTAAALGSVLLGGHPLLALARAGVVDVAADAPLAASSLALTSQAAPHCGWVF